jgi:citrate lyase beta subunit
MTILDEAKAHLDALGAANRAFMQTYPGDRAARQPVHTVYGGAQLFKAETTARLGAVARATMEAYGATPEAFARGVGFTADADGWLARTVHERVRRKLEREPVEDFRIDFEDGFGARPDAEEDATAVTAAREVARGLREAMLPPFIGIRIKSMGEEWKARSARTLEIFLDTLLAESRGVLPANFVVTLPKVTVAEQPRTLVRLFEILERRHGLAAGTLRMEFMVEVTQAIIGADGRSPLPGFLAACEGRCVGAHFGTYDYTASCNVTAAFQVMDHPWCDLAKGNMLLSFAGSGIFLSDGSTNVLPVPPNVHDAWQLSHRHIRHSLEGGFYQGWDLHPAQIPVRFATCFAFFLEGFAQAADRLRNFIEKAAQATLVGDVFDDAATGQGLLNYFLRALNSGAIEVADLERTGLTPAEVELRSFAKILAARRARLSAG